MPRILRQIRALVVAAPEDGSVTVQLTAEHERSVWERLRAARQAYTATSTTLVEHLNAGEAVTLGAILIGHAIKHDVGATRWAISAMEQLLEQAKKERAIHDLMETR